MELVWSCGVSLNRIRTQNGTTGYKKNEEIIIGKTKLKKKKQLLTDVVVGSCKLTMPYTLTYASGLYP